jgi:copper chaperone CopZ
VPVYITKDSHIQCEQLHTIPKSELIDFKGMVPTSTLSNVKAKLRIQFDMNTDRNTELFNTIKKNLEELTAKTEPEILNKIRDSIEALHEKADKGFGVPALEDEILNLLLNLDSGFQRIEAAITKLPVVSAAAVSVDKAATISRVVNKGRGKRRDYTEEDKIFIADKNNSVESLMEKFGYDRTTALKMRAYFKKRVGNSPNDLDRTPLKEAGKRGSKYTEEEINFVLDTSNTPDALMNRFGFKDVKKAYSLRKYIKKMTL